VTGMVDSFFDDLEVGMEEVTRGRTITEADVVNWCSLTGDWFVMHSDAEFAARSPFGQRIVPGVQVYAYTGGLGVPPVAHAIVANYGAERIRYPRPTFIGDTIRCQIRVADLTVRNDSTGVATFDWNAVSQHDELVMTSQLKVLLRRNADVDVEL
jgi:3-hydroxybutyryl-CoA dehydratase